MSRAARRRQSHGLHIFLTVILVILTACVVVKAFFLKAPEQKAAELPASQPAEEENSPSDEEQAAQEALRSHLERKGGFYTILVSGVDDGNGGSDTNILVAVDTVNGYVYGVSIPRDSKAIIGGKAHKINYAYNKGGISLLADTVSEQLGVPVDYTVCVDLKGFTALVDAIGGIDFEVPINMNYDDPIQNLSIHQTKGYRLLSGDDAMQVLRYRHDNKKNGKMLGYADGDLGRIKTQQGLLKAMIEQLMSLKNITKVNEFIKVFNENVETDLSLQNMLWFAKQAFLGNSSGAKLDTAQVNFVTMPNTNVSCWSRVYHSYQSYVTPNAQELLELVNNELSPFVEPSTMSDLDIMSVNKNGSVSSTTGHVEDSKATVAPVTGGSKSDASNEPGADEDGNLINPGDGETAAPGGEETGTDTPAVEPTTPEKPGTDTSDPGTTGGETENGGETGNGGETENGGGETPDQPEDPGVIVVPPEPTEPDPAPETET